MSVGIRQFRQTFPRTRLNQIGQTGEDLLQMFLRLFEKKRIIAFLRPEQFRPEIITRQPQPFGSIVIVETTSSFVITRVVRIVVITDVIVIARIQGFHSEFAEKNLFGLFQSQPNVIFVEHFRGDNGSDEKVRSELEVRPLEGGVDGVLVDVSSIDERIVGCLVDPEVFLEIVVDPL